MLASLRLPLTLPTPGGGVRVRRAVPDDAEGIMELLGDDPFSSDGDSSAEDVPVYRAALIGILDDRRNDLVVAVDGGTLVGTLQLTVIPGMARRGSTRLTVEAVRVASHRRGSGIGSALLRWVLDSAPALDVDLVQLTSNASRVDSHRFYERLGFVGSHRGFKYQV